ncbi:MAG TPA: dienelactone hydrolase family protein [Actinomycetota bacterium]
MGSTIQWREPPDDRTNRSTGEMVSFGKHRDAGRGYMARSERVGPGVLVLHEFFGLQDSFVAYADRLNRAGFTVLVPDLYDGEIASSVDAATALARSLDRDATMRKLRAAADLLTANWHPRLGVVGFSLGADLAVELAALRPIEALVVYYGTGSLGDGRWNGPTLGHFAENDEWTPLSEAEAAFDALEAADVDAELIAYPGLGHWFANAAVIDSYDAEADAAAFEATSEFLHHHLA